LKGYGNGRGDTGNEGFVGEPSQPADDLRDSTRRGGATKEPLAELRRARASREPLSCQQNTIRLVHQRMSENEVRDPEAMVRLARGACKISAGGAWCRARSKSCPSGTGLPFL